MALERPQHLTRQDTLFDFLILPMFLQTNAREVNVVEVKVD